MVKNFSIALFALLIVSFLLTTGCGNSGKQINERVTLWRKDKIPYGTFYAYEELARIFPDAEIVIDKEGDKKNNVFGIGDNNLDYKVELHKGKVADIIITPTVNMEAEDLQRMMNFVYGGNKLFISAFELSPLLLDTLKLDTHYFRATSNSSDSLNISILHPKTYDKQSFTYPGKSYDNYFTSLDSGYTTILGWNEDGLPNFVKISYESGGAIYLHLAPMAFTNFFLLHKKNKEYYDQVFSNIPAGTELVKWDETFRNKSASSGGSSSTSRIFNWMMKQPALAMGLWLLLALFLLLFIFEAKRKQRLIPVRPPLKNTSLDFVKTIGRLYFQRRDNRNLAIKMTAHFQDFVRTKFAIPTSRMDEAFEKKLAYKTGIDAEVIGDIIYQAKYLADQSSVTDNELQLFNKQLENFYKKV